MVPHETYFFNVYMMPSGTHSHYRKEYDIVESIVEYQRSIIRDCVDVMESIWMEFNLSPHSFPH